MTKQVKYTSANVGREPSIRIEFDGSVETYTPEQVSAMILGQVKQDSEKPLVGTLADSVITASVAFNEAQRLATKQTRMIAGIDVRAVIN